MWTSRQVFHFRSFSPFSPSFACQLGLGLAALALPFAFCTYFFFILHLTQFAGPNKVHCTATPTDRLYWGQNGGRGEERRGQRYRKLLLNGKQLFCAGFLAPALLTFFLYLFFLFFLHFFLVPFAGPLTWDVLRDRTLSQPPWAPGEYSARGRASGGWYRVIWILPWLVAACTTKH